MPGDLTGHILNQTQKSSPMLVIDSSPTWMWFGLNQRPFGLKFIRDSDTPSGSDARRSSLKTKYAHSIVWFQVILRKAMYK